MDTEKMKNNKTVLNLLVVAATGFNAIKKRKKSRFVRLAGAICFALSDYLEQREETSK